MRWVTITFLTLSLLACSEKKKTSQPASKGLEKTPPSSISYKDTLVNIQTQDSSFSARFPIFYSSANHSTTDSLIYFELSLDRLFGSDIDGFKEEWEQMNEGVINFNTKIYFNQNSLFSCKTSAQFSRIENAKFINLNLKRSEKILLVNEIKKEKVNDFYELLDLKTIGINTNDDPLDTDLNRISFTFDANQLYLHLYHPLSGLVDVVKVKWDEVASMLKDDSVFINLKHPKA